MRSDHRSAGEISGQCLACSQLSEYDPTRAGITSGKISTQL
nr:hypothetical protein [Kosakonia oryzae]